ncbi:YjgN family protein [Thiofilum flexile]|uniref:YjgN family protein n=1 Tax=Thiofilum flexile TaxID=125627 RepID=UPI00037FB441|nr:YjgN family protein [Thiofilum flexile]
MNENEPAFDTAPSSELPPQAATPSFSLDTRFIPFQFTGSGSEYFKIWIVNILLSIVTLGIYSAWATVRTKRYFYGNTIFDQASFEYHATPIQILKGRIIAIVLVIAYVVLTQISPELAGILILLLGFLSPWIVWSGLRFNARMSSYRNVRFGFSGKLKRLIYIMLILPFIPVIIGFALVAILMSIGLVFDTGSYANSFVVVIFTLAAIGFYAIAPYAHKLYTEYYFNHFHYGQGQFNTQLETKNYYKIYLKMLLITIGVYIVVAIAIGFLVIPLIGATASLGNDDPSIGSTISLSIIVGLFYFLIIVIGMFLNAYLKARIRNYSYNETQLDQVLRLHSDTSVLTLWKIYVLNLFLLVITLGLAHPWNKVRLARYETQTLKAEVAGTLDHYINQRQSEQSSLGDQIGDVFDLPIGSGLGL